MKVLVSITTTSRSHLEGAPQKTGARRSGPPLEPRAVFRFFLKHEPDARFLIGCFVFAVLLLWRRGVRDFNCNRRCRKLNSGRLEREPAPLLSRAKTRDKYY